jgi:hypothetical protein
MESGKLSEPLPPEISKLRNLSEKGKESISEISGAEFEAVINETQKYLRTRYVDIFNNEKIYESDHIAEVVFEYFFEEAQIRQYLMCSWQGIEITLKRTSNHIQKVIKTHCHNRSSISSDLEYFWDLVFDIVMFLSYAENLLSEEHKGYGLGKRSVANSTEIFEASVDLLRHRSQFKTFSHFIRQPTSAFLIRQSIELRVKNALGINVIFNKNGALLKLRPDLLIDFLYSKSQITVPVKKSIVTKIHKWTNYYIHGGLLPEVWKIDFAHNILSPLFNCGEKPTVGWSFYGAIEIEKEYFDKKLYDDLKSYICSKLTNITPKEVNIVKISPEALLI